MVAKYTAKLIAAYGQRVISDILSGRMLNLDLIDKVAKQIQKEANRRYDVAMRHKEMTKDRPFKVFEASGGKIALSKMFSWQNGKRVLNANETQAERIQYLTIEIRRGLDYLNEERSSFTGTRKAIKNLGYKLQAAAAKTTGNQKNPLPAPTQIPAALALSIMQIVEAFMDKYAALFRASEVVAVVTYIYEVNHGYDGLTIDEAVQLTLDYFSMSAKDFEETWDFPRPDENTVFSWYSKYKGNR